MTIIDPNSVTAVPILQAFPEHAIVELFKRARIRRYRQHEIIHNPDEPQNHLAIIAEGKVRMCSYNREGREAILAILETGTWYGDNIFADNSPRVFGVVAHENCKIIEIPQAIFFNAMAQYPQAYPAVLAGVGKRLSSALALLQDNALHNTAVKLARRLLFMAELQGKDTNASTPITLSLTKEMLANFVGMTRQGIHPLLLDYERRKLLSFHYGTVTLCNPKALSAELTLY